MYPRTACGVGQRRRSTELLLLTFLITLLPLSVPVHADSGYQVFVPLVVTEPRCEPSSQEAEFEALFRSDPNQTRAAINCNPTLSAVAQQRAEDMAARHYFSHVNPDGVGPNQLVRDAGYHLPSFYSMERDGNNIESIAGGFASAQEAWTGLLGSPAHRRHLLGEVDFYREQIDLGIGFVEDPDSDYRYYWVILTARTGE